MRIAAVARPQAVAINARRLDKNTLRGAFDLQLASGLVLRGCTLHLSHGRWWVGLPAKPFTNSAGGQTWSAIVDFRDRATRDRFQAAALAAARLVFPEIEERR